MRKGFKGAKKVFENQATGKRLAKLLPDGEGVSATEETNIAHKPDAPLVSGNWCLTGLPEDTCAVGISVVGGKS